MTYVPVCIPLGMVGGIYEGVSSGMSQEHILDSANDALAFIGYVVMQGGYDTGAQTFGTSGAKIHFPTHTNSVWSDASTNVRIGIQDVNLASGATPAQPDGTFDIYCDISPGGTNFATVPSSAIAMQAVSLDTGTPKSIAQGDLIAVVLELTALGGSDHLDVRGLNTFIGERAFINFYNGTSWNSGSLKAPCVVLESDEGTFASLYGGGITYDHDNSNALVAGGTNEVGLEMSLPFACKIGGIWHNWDIDTEDVTHKLYTGATTSPVLEESAVQDFDHTQDTRPHIVMFDTEVTIPANTLFAVVGDCTSGSLGGTAYYFSSASHFLATPYVNSDMKQVSRSGGTGPFSSTTGKMAPMGPLITAIDDGAGTATGGGGGRIIGG